jgi:hypothetical protein
MWRFRMLASVPLKSFMHRPRKISEFKEFVWFPTYSIYTVSYVVSCIAFFSMRMV